MRLDTYQPGDEAHVDARADFRQALAEEGSLPPGPKWTLIAGDRVLAVGGFDPLGSGEWAMWAYVADLRPREWLRAALHTRRLVTWWAAAFPNDTIRAVPVDGGLRAPAERLLRRMGFGDPLRGVMNRKAA